MQLKKKRNDEPCLRTRSYTSSKNIRAAKIYEQQRYTCSKDDQMNLRPKTSEAEENRQSDG